MYSVITFGSLENSAFFSLFFRVNARRNNCIANINSLFLIIITYLRFDLLIDPIEFWDGRCSQLSRLGVLKAMIVGLLRIYRKLWAKDLFCGLKYAKPRDWRRALRIWTSSKDRSDSDRVYSRKLKLEISCFIKMGLKKTISWII